METDRARKRRRDPEGTRQRLLQAAFREMQRDGYRSADLDRILQEAGVTKGALYHHFDNKRALGYAVIDEVLRSWILERWTRPLLEREDPIGALIELAQWGERHATPAAIAFGCPLAVLAEELAGIDEGFRLRLAEIYRVWRDRLVDRLRLAQTQGTMRRDVDPETAATFVVASWRGSIGLAKALSDEEILRRCRQGLEGYLMSLRVRTTEPGPADL